MGKQAAAIQQGLLQICRRHQLPMGRQGGQGLLQPGEPLGQLGLHRKPACQGLLQGGGSF